VESEIAFLLARDIEAPATVTSVLAATEVVFGAVDVLDSRYESFQFTLTDVVADNASAGAFYLGPIARRPDELVDLRLLGCVVRVDGDVAMTAAGAAVMGHPAASVAWLANQLAAEGEGLRAGQLVFSGGVTAPVPVVGGGSVTFEFDQLGDHRGLRRLAGRREEPRARGTVLVTAVVPTEAAPATPSSCSPTSAARTRSSRSTVPGRRPAGVRLRHRHGPARGRPARARGGRRGRRVPRPCAGRPGAPPRAVRRPTGARRSAGRPRR
jgi:hypothetical protein